MNPNPGTAAEPNLAAPPANAAVRTPKVGVGATAVLLIGTWIGLIAGFLDVAALVVTKRWISPDFYRLGDDFPWIIPTGVMVLVLIPALPMAGFARLRGPIRLSLPIGLLSFLGFLDLCARLRLENWATVIVCAGLATQTVRWVGKRPEGFLRLVRRTAGVLAAGLIATIGATVGGRAWSEHRQTTAMPPATPGAPNVLLIVWDTVRAANTSLHGYKRSTTPNLERLATRGTRFDMAFATSSWTLPSHASMFTSRWPHELGVGWKSPIRDDLPTIAEALATKGYDTAGFVGNLDYCSRETGLARGFAHYEDFPISIADTFSRYIALGRRIETSSWPSTVDQFVEKQTGRWYDLIPTSREHIKNADTINSNFLSWLKNRSKSDRPFFAFLNYNDAHSPYEVPEPNVPGFGLRPTNSSQRQMLQGFSMIDKTMLSRDDVRMAIDVYDDSISYLDRRLGNLLDELGRRKALDNTLVIVTSDHGEHLGDHGLFFHGCSLYRQLVQVPLVIVGHEKIPAGHKVGEPVSLGDLPATLFDLLGFGSDHDFKGRSMARYWQPRDPEGARIVADPMLMETTKPVLLMNGGREPAAKGPLKAVVAAGMHYIQVADGSEELYNLSADADEKTNLTRDPSALSVLVEFRNVMRLLLQKR